MRFLLILFTLAIGFLAGCKKKTPPVVEATPTQPGGAPSIPAPSASESTRLLKQLAKTKREPQLATADLLATLAETDPTVIPGLLELLKDKTNLGEGQVLPHQPNSVREAAVIALIYCGEPGESAAVEKGLPILLTALTDTDAPVREHALIAVARLKLKAKSAIPKIWPLAEDASTFVRDAAYHCLAELGVTSPPQVVKLLSHPEEGVRVTAAEQLSRFKPLPANSVEALRTALVDPNKFVRTTAAEALLDFGAKAAPAAPDLAESIRKSAKEAQPNVPYEFDFSVLNLLVTIGAGSVEPVGQLLADKDQLVLYQALYVLGEIGPPAKETAEAIFKIIGAEAHSPDVRLEACRALTTVTGDAAKATPLMKIALTHKEAQLRNLGLQAAARMGVPGRSFAETITPLLEDAEPIIRKQAIAYVATLDSKGRAAAVPRLAKLLKDEIASVRTAAVNALADFGPLAATAADDLVKAAATDDDTEVRQIALAALAELGPSATAAKPTLLATIRDGKAGDELRGTALRVLVAMAPAEALESVLKLLGDPSESVRLQATGSAVHLKSATVEIIAKLAALATNDTSAAVRTRATRALAEIEPKPIAAKDRLESLAKSTFQDRAHWAKIALARIDNRSADLDKLIRSGLVGKFGEKVASIEALGRIIPATAAEFLPVDQISRSKDSALRQRAAETLGRFDKVPALAIPRLIEMLQDRDEDVQISVIQALGKFAPQDATAAVKPLQLKSRGDTKVNRVARHSLALLAG